MANVNPNQLIVQGQDMQQLDLLYRIQNILNAYVIGNYLLLNQAAQSQIVTIINPNLYRVAVQYYGDVNYWTVIANINSLPDPQLTGTFTLLIPPKPAINPGGVLNPTIS